MKVKEKNFHFTQLQYIPRRAHIIIISVFVHMYLNFRMPIDPKDVHFLYYDYKAKVILQ